MKKTLINTLRAAVGAALVATAAFAPCVAQAQDYPSRPIRLLIPFPPGGGTDFVSRVVATKLSESLKWQVIPENRPGASGNLAIAEAAKSAPDGYTIVMGQSDNMMLGPWLYPNVGYDTVQSFMPIVQVSEAPLAIVSNMAPPAPQAKLGNVADMVAKGKAGTGLTWATAGNGSLGHVFGEQFRSTAAIKLLQVPYKGATPGLNDLMVGSVDVAIMSVPSVLPLVRGGKLNPVAVTTSKRSAMLPDTPTLSEAGIKGIDAGIWLGLFAPVGTPPAIVARLNAEVNKVLQMPDVREKIANGGATAIGGSSEDFAAFVRADYAKWGKVVKEAGIKLE
ncbi:MAG: tripartite tricarboxylate transporter substrate binding protein [Burkholderiales bacterium]|nr:tripartite tricarboxylate transporter substrate binding protein [Burkholderiales bacterium]